MRARNWSTRAFTGSTRRFRGSCLTGQLWRTNLAGGSVYKDQRIMQKRDGTRFWAEARGRSKHPEDPFAEAIYCFEPMARAVGPDKALTGRRLQIVALVAQAKPMR